MDTDDPTTYEETSDGTFVVCRTLRAAKAKQMALSSHPGHNASTLMVKIRKIPAGPETAKKKDPAQTPYPCPSVAIDTDEAHLILDGSVMASEIGQCLSATPAKKRWL